MPVSPVRLLPLLTNPGAPKQQAMFRPLNIATTGMSAQRLRMEVIATNVANAETTRGPNGVPYQRRFVTIQEAQAPMAPVAFPALPSEQGGGIAPADPTAGYAGVQVQTIEEDATEGPLNRASPPGSSASGMWCWRPGCSPGPWTGTWTRSG